MTNIISAIKERKRILEGCAKGFEAVKKGERNAPKYREMARNYRFAAVELQMILSELASLDSV